ncbi:hypothetical protein OAZ91_00105 [bacterium]|nr:hypothetical protein [bacterium]
MPGPRDLIEGDGAGSCHGRAGRAWMDALTNYAAANIFIGRGGRCQNQPGSGVAGLGAAALDLAIWPSIPACCGEI